MVLPIYKAKGDPMECASYRRIKLLEHATKVVERIFKNRIRQQVDIHDKPVGDLVHVLPPSNFRALLFRNKGLNQNSVETLYAGNLGYHCTKIL